MVERPHTGPLPPAHPIPYGRPPHPDGDTIPCPPAPLPRRQRLPGLIIAGIVLALMVAGIAGCLG